MKRDACALAAGTAATVAMSLLARRAFDAEYQAELGTPEGREAGFRHPAVLVTAQRILDAAPSVIHVVPLTSTIRSFHVGVP